jgi:demethylmenaquinone methyltransferase/2-methoxy-6-polyprenyl-1,4-benzoquinol methylase
MANPFYAPGTQRAPRVGDLFATIASRYDLLNDIQSLGLHRLWKGQLVRLAGVEVGAPVLDICCGTGDIALRLAHAGARTTGLDFSEPMLAVARQRAQQQGFSEDRLRYFQGDAMQLPFEDDCFAAATVGYGLRNLADWTTGLSEMLRVVRAGGRVLVLDFGKPRNALLRTAYFAYLRVMVPLFGLLFCRNAAAYAYILESLRNYPAQEGVAAEMRRLGLGDVRTLNLLGGMMSINIGVKQGAETRTP